MKFLLIIFITLSLQATATFTAMRTFTQSNGFSFQGRLQGDAFMHWIEAQDGSILLFNKKSGNFEYALIKDGDLCLSGNIYLDTKLRSLHPHSIDKESLKKLWSQRHH